MTSPAPRGRMWSIDNLRQLLEPAGGMKIRSNSQFSARCPVHDDSHASLSVTWSDDGHGGKVLLHCHGCGASGKDIADALGISLADLFDTPLPPRPEGRRVGRSSTQRASGKRRGRVGGLPKPIAVREVADKIEHTWEQVEVYPYCDAAGNVVQEVVREECTSCELGRHKQFRQLFVTALGRRLKKKPHDFTPVLYRMPELVGAVAAGTPVWLLEGEKDVASAEGLGLIATTNTQGGRAFPSECAELFRGATVRVVLDRDDAGWDRGVDLASLLGGVEADVQLLLPGTTGPKTDFTDHVEAGLWTNADDFGGLLKVSAAEVAAHAIAGTARAKALLIEKAAAEAQARADLAQDDDLEAKRAKRWALEAEIRFEVLRDVVDHARRQAADAGTEWAGAAADEAVSVWQLARNAARLAHEVAKVPLPPILQDEQPSTDDADTEREDTRAVGQTGVFEAGASVPVGESRSRRGVAISAPTFRIVDGQLVEITTNKDGGEQAKLVLGIDARIVEMEYLETQDDSVDVDAPLLLGREGISGQREANPPSPEQLSAVVIGYTHPATGEFMRLRVDAMEFRDCGWIESLPGPPAYDSRPSGIAKVRDALKVAGGSITRTVRFRSTGWRRDEAGEWFFVHAGGAITSSGAKVAPVLLTGPLARYDLPAPSADVEKVRDAFFAHSASMLTLMPTRIGAAMLGHVYRSAMGPNPWVLLMVGSPGSYKTSVASIGMHHWGELWDRRRPATSMSGNGDTLNALRIKLNSAKDALYWADDVAPTRDWGAAQKSLEEFARMVHNGEQRSRSTRDGLSVLDGTPPRASAIVTSEVMPRPGSGAQRMLAVPMQKEELDLDDLKNLDRDESRHGRALLMATFLQYLAGRLDATREMAFSEADQYAQVLRDSGESVRQAEAIGAVWAGWVAMTRFLVDIGALSTDEARTTLDIVDEGLLATAAAAADPDLPSRTGARVRELIAHALRTGQAYVDDVRTGEAPDRPLAGRLGWRRTLVGEFQDVKKYREDARGIRLGYVLTDPGPRDGEAQLLLESTALEQVLKAAAQSMSDAPQIDRGTALRALHDEGILIAEERAGRTPRYTVQRTIHCEDRRQRLTALRLWKVIGEDPDDNDDGAVEFDRPDPQGPNRSDPSTVLPTLIEQAGERRGSGLESADSAASATSSTEDARSADVNEIENSASVGSEDSSGSIGSAAVTERDLTSPAAPDQETNMPIETDAEGNTADAELIEPTECALCGADEAGWMIDGLAMHLPCWWQSTAATRASARGETVSSPALEKATADTTAPTPTQVKATPTPPTPKTPTDFTAPAAVLDVDGVWLADGTCVPVPEQFRHVGDAAELVSQLNLGTWTNKDKTWSVPGQIWITDAMLRSVGVDTESLGKRKRNDRLRELTAESSFVADALADGWQLGGKPGNSLGTWTRVWRGEKKGVWVALISGMSSNEEEMPILADDPAPVDLARRLANFATAVSFPWMISPAATGIDLMIASRPREWKRVFGPSSSDAVTTSLKPYAPDIDWTRTLTKEESACRYVHAYDRGGSYLAALAGLELPIGEATHFPDGTVFDAKVPGYWLIEVPESSDWRFPNPLNPLVNPKIEPQWVTTPTLERAAQFGYEPQILEAHLWQEHGRVLLPWYERSRDARASLDRAGDVDAQRARDQLKVMYTHTLGMLNSKLHLENKVGYSPERHFHIIAKATANILYRIEQIGRTSGSWPVAVLKDTVLYVSDEADPAKAWPGAKKQYGRGLGQYKPEGSALLDEHRDFLTGYSYKGKQSLISPDTWEANPDAESAS